MKFVQYQDCKSPHQVPLAYELAKKFGDGYRYVYRDRDQSDRANLGWQMSEKDESWMVWLGDEGAEDLIENADVLLTMFRDVELFERRKKKGLVTFYQSERWFKPLRFMLPGILRLLHPGYFCMAYKFVKLLRSNKNLIYLPMGVHAARDMARLCGLAKGDLRCVFRSPRLEFNRQPLGRIAFNNDTDVIRYCLDRMRLWGYFVKHSEIGRTSHEKTGNSKSIRLLWIGRFLRLKRVDTIIRAVFEYAKLRRKNEALPKITLDIYGSGEEEYRLKKMAGVSPDEVVFYPSVKIDAVRKLMREHDVYVLASNAYEGWGAVVSEALEEGMRVVGTYEAGSSATILPDSNLFHAGDWRALLNILQRKVGRIADNYWNVTYASDKLLSIIMDHR